MREMYCLGDYVSQIGKRVKKYKKKPSIDQIYNIQKYLGVNIQKCLVNNVRFTEIVHLNIYQDYVTIVSDCTFEKMQLYCDKFNKIGEIYATCFCVAGKVAVKFTPVKFLQVSLILAEKHGVDLRSRIFNITP